MAKLTLEDLASLTNQTSALATMAANNTAIETAMENTLSRDGTSPNSMTGNIDMNDNRIINLPTAVSLHEPVTLAQAQNLLTADGLIEDSDFITEGTTNLFLTVSERALIAGAMQKSENERVTIDLLATDIDTSIWNATTGLRVGSDLAEDGTATPASANEFAVSIQTRTPSTGALASYEKTAAIFIAATSDPSSYGPDITKDVVGLDMRGYILAGNTTGRAWGGYSEGRVFSTGDGLLYAHEFYIHNDGSNQTGVDQVDSKYGAHFVATGTYNSTAAIKTTGVSGVKWNTGIHLASDSIVTHALRVDGLFSVRMNGLLGIGTDSPDRTLHAEVSDSATNTISYANRLSHITSGTAAASFGVGQEFELENASGTNRVSGRINNYYSQATDAAEYAEFSFDLIKNGAIESNVFKINSFGTVTAAGSYAVGANQVLGARVTGFVTAAGTANKDASAINVGTITATDANIRLVAAWVKSLHDALATHGAIGA